MSMLIQSFYFLPLEALLIIFSLKIMNYSCFIFLSKTRISSWSLKKHIKLYCIVIQWFQPPVSRNVIWFLMLDHKRSITLYRRLVPKTNWETDVTEWSETGNCSLITRVCCIGLRCKTLTFKTRLSAKPFLWKCVLFAWKLKTILISMALQLASLWNRGLGQRGDGLFC